MDHFCDMWPTRSTNRDNYHIRPTGPIWQKSVNFVIFALERVVDAMFFNVCVKCDHRVITLKKGCFYATEHKFYKTLYRPDELDQPGILLRHMINSTNSSDQLDQPTQQLSHPTNSTILAKRDVFSDFRSVTIVTCRCCHRCTKLRCWGCNRIHHCFMLRNICFVRCRNHVCRRLAFGTFWGNWSTVLMITTSTYVIY